MNRGDIIELENFLFESLKRDSNKKKDYTVPAMLMADIMGVLIDSKPAASIVFLEDELERINIFKLINLLRKLGLETMHYVSHDLLALAYTSDDKKDEHLSSNRIVHLFKLFISKDSDKLALAYNTAMKFEKAGPLLSEKEYKDVVKQMGEVLGYPKTAIDFYVGDNSEEICNASWRYYIHSIKHEKEEFNTFDLKLNEAITKYAPKTAKVLSGNKGEPWLTYA